MSKSVKKVLYIFTPLKIKFLIHYSRNWPNIAIAPKILSKQNISFWWKKMSTVSSDSMSDSMLNDAQLVRQSWFKVFFEKLSLSDKGVPLFSGFSKINIEIQLALSLVHFSWVLFSWEKFLLTLFIILIDRRYFFLWIPT